MVIVFILLKEKIIKKTAIMLVIAAVIFVNIPQIISETRSGGLNSKSLIWGAKDKNKKNSNLGENLLLDLSCHIKTGGHIISSLGEEDE